MQLIVVRHGESEANKAGIVGTDSNLTALGKQQAKDLAKSLQGEDIDAIYCSPLKRTSQTALPLAEQLKKEIYIDRRIREIDWGDFNGKTEKHFEEVIGMPIRQKSDTYDYDYSHYHGEKVSDVEARVRSFVDDLKKTSYKKVVVVCHGGIVRMFNYVITGQKITYLQNAQKLHYKI